MHCSAEGCDSLGQLHLNLLSDLLPLLVAADREDVPLLQLLLTGSVPELDGQQFLPDPAGECPWRVGGGGHRGHRGQTEAVDLHEANEDDQQENHHE